MWATAMARLPARRRRRRSCIEWSRFTRSFRASILRWRIAGGWPTSRRTHGRCLHALKQKWRRSPASAWARAASRYCAAEGSRSLATKAGCARCHPFARSDIGGGPPPMSQRCRQCRACKKQHSLRRGTSCVALRPGPRGPTRPSPSKQARRPTAPWDRACYQRCRRSCRRQILSS